MKYESSVKRFNEVSSKCQEVSSRYLKIRYIIIIMILILLPGIKLVSYMCHISDMCVSL